MSAAYIEALYLCGCGDKTFENIDSLKIIRDEGIEGDRHADGGDRQIALFSAEAKKALASETPGLCGKKFHENILTAGLDLAGLKPGDVLSAGSAKIMITGGKGACQYGDCVKADSGEKCSLKSSVRFAKVIQTGIVSVKDELIFAENTEAKKHIGL